MARSLKALILGDIVGRSGCRAVFIGLQKHVKKYSADVVVINAENAVEGFGITPEVAGQIFSAGANVITTGNHIWQQGEVLSYLDTEDRILRPANYPSGVHGHGTCIVEVKGRKIGVINLQGRTRMWTIDCPFKKGRELVRKMRQETKIIFVDFHAEATDEKEALGCYLDGEVTAIVGTHTHIQTADERILPGGTAYITDLGMTGPSDSVIGFDPRISVQRSLTQMPLRNEVSDNPATIQGIVLEVDQENGRALSVERVREESLV